MPEIILRGKGLSVAYGGVKAVSDVDLEIASGEVIGLIGPNGAGKTSLIDGLSGFAIMTGDLTLKGQPILRLRPHVRRRLGLSRTWQSVAMFDDLTVAENVEVALRGPGSERHAVEQARALLDRLDIGDLAERLPGEISHGQRVLVGVARALASSPALILMDEPAAGLDSVEGRELGTVIKSLVGDGTSVLLIDHDMSLVMDVCHRIYVLNFGRTIASGTPAQIADDPAVSAAYLGSARESTPGSDGSSASAVAAGAGTLVGAGTSKSDQEGAVGHE